MSKSFRFRLFQQIWAPSTEIALDQPESGNYFLVAFLRRLSRIKCSQVRSWGKFGPAAFNLVLGFMGFRSILKQTFFGHPVCNFLYKIWIFCYLLNRICTQSLCQLQGIPIEMPNLIDRYGNKDWKLQSMHVNLFSRSCVFLLLFMPVFVFVLWPMLTRVLWWLVVAGLDRWILW